MNDPPWPALPNPGRLVRLPLPSPPQLLELAGYNGGSRLIALWWTPFGDELMLSDGTTTTTGSWRGWLAFSGHELVVILAPYKLGSSDEEAEHRLFVDRQCGTLAIGLARDVEQLLATEPSELQALTAHLSTEQTRTLLERAMQDQLDRRAAKTPAQLRRDTLAALERETKLLEALRAFLDRALNAIDDPTRPSDGDWSA